MSKVLTPQKALLSQKKTGAAKPTTPTAGDNGSTSLSSSSAALDFDDFTTSSSILEFLSKEQECCSDADAESIFQEVSRLADNSDTRSVDEILREAELLIQQQTLLGRAATKTTRGSAAGCGSSVAGHKKTIAAQQSIKLNEKYTKRIENVRPPTAVKLLNGHCRSDSFSSTPTTPNKAKAAAASVPVDVIVPPTPQTPISTGGQFAAFVDNLPSESVISEESTPKDMLTYTATTTITAQLHDDDADDGTDTLEEITEGIETIELVVNEIPCAAVGAFGKNFEAYNAAAPNEMQLDATAVGGNTANDASLVVLGTSKPLTKQHNYAAFGRRPSSGDAAQVQQHAAAGQAQLHLGSPTRRLPLNFNATQACSPSPNERRHSGGTRRASMTTPDSGIGLSAHSTQSQTLSYTLPRPYSPLRLPASAPVKSYSDKSTNSSPQHLVSSLTSPIEPFAAITREHALKHEIEQLQEKLKDTEERLQSLRIQHDSLSQLHRDLRESSTHLQEESELLQLDVQHLNECANVLRTELQAARTDRNEALELQKALQTELEDSRREKKRTQEQREKDTRTIQDLHRQCREMERILMRKHPDSVSALIVASKNPGMCASNDQENFNSRKLLEQRIAQLEADAKEQDLKAQQILANVQARFNSVQSKYETHIADLETQVLSLQEINTKLNEKIESQVRTLDYFVTKKAEKYYNNCTQTEADTGNGHAATSVTFTAGTQTASSTVLTRDHSTNTIGSSTTQQQQQQQNSASSSTSSTANSTPNNSRPNSKQSGLRKPIATASGTLSTLLSSKLPVSQSESTIAHLASAKEDAHLLATIRGMRIDLAIKDKAMQRLSRELDECKKTMRKLQREKDAQKSDRLQSGGSSVSLRRGHDAAADYHHTPAHTESQALREAHNKIKLLEADYKSLHDKRLQDLKTLQTAHERELASCHETVRILQQRLSERDEAFATQKRRKVPVDYYALKAKVRVAVHSGRAKARHVR